MKPILKASEIDDSRPTVVRVMNREPMFVSVLSGKINTVYDLDERRTVYTEILDELLADPAVVPLLEDQNIAVCSHELGGYKAAVYGITLDKVYWRKGAGKE